MRKLRVAEKYFFRNVEIGKFIDGLNQILYRDGLSINMDFHNGIPCIEIEEIIKDAGPYSSKLLDRIYPSSEFDVDLLDSEEDEKLLHFESFVILLLNLFIEKYKKK